MQMKFELILAIVNAGFEDAVMEAAQQCGIRGGTVLSARGTAKAEAEKAFGIVVHSDKSIVMMVATKTARDEALKVLYQSMGKTTEANGIVFSLPVDEVSENLLRQLAPESITTEEEA